MSRGHLPAWSAAEARGIMEQILGRTLDANGATVCPGDAAHTTSHGKPDFKLFTVGKVPYAHCFHTNCYDRVMEVNREMWRRLFGKVRGGEDRAFQESGMRRVKEVIKKRQDFSALALASEQLSGLVVGRRWLRERSPIDPEGVSATGFLQALYGCGEKVLVFERMMSQGEYGFVRTSAGGHWVELGRDRREAHVVLEGQEVPGPLRAGKEGIWYLAQPVDGHWYLDPDLIDRQTGLPKWSRRSKLAVTDWRFMVLESDSARVDHWLNFIVQLGLRIVALYTSGGRSVHALVRVNAGSRAQWDEMCRMMQPILSLLGADPAAMSSVRLTRLPGCIRRGKMRQELYRDPSTGAEEKRSVYHRFEQPLMQRLLYLNPGAEAVPILNLQPVRSIVEGEAADA